MSSVLFCVETSEKPGERSAFRCKMIVDGRIEREWDVSKISIENVGGRADIYEDIDRRVVIIGTDDYLGCEKSGDTLKCKGESRKPRGWTERFGV